jgi:hypothetical protein
MCPPGQQGKAVWWTTISCSHSYFLFTDAKLVDWAIWFRKLDVGVCLLTQLAVLGPGDQERNRNTESVKFQHKHFSKSNPRYNKRRNPPATYHSRNESSMWNGIILVYKNQRSDIPSLSCLPPLHSAILTVVMLRPVMKPPYFPINVMSQHRLFYHTTFLQPPLWLKKIPQIHTNQGKRWKVNLSQGQATKEKRGNRGIALLF